MEVMPQRRANIAPSKPKLSAMKPLLKIFSELRPHVKLIAVNQAICLATLGLGFTIPFILKWLTEQIQNGDYSVLLWVPLVSFVVLVLLAVVQMLRSILSQFISIKIAQGLQRKILRHYLDNDIITFFSQPTGERISRLTFDIQWFVEGAAIFLSETLYLPLVVSGCIGVMVHFDYRLALVAIGVSPIAILANKLFAKKLKTSSIAMQQHNAVLSRHIFDTLKGMLLIKVFAKEDQESKRFDSLLDKFVQLQIRNNFWGSLFKTTIGIGNGLVVCLVCWYAFYLLTGTKTLTIPTFVAFSSVMFYFFGEIGKIGSIMSTLIRTAVSCERIYGLIEGEQTERNEGEAKASFTTGLNFENVSFEYEDGKEIFRNVDLQLKRGERIALMGMSGAGKTTLIHLMLGLLQPLEGKISMDGEGISKYERDSWRSLFGYAPQLNVIFYMSIADNIAFSKPGVTREEVERVAKIACAHDFITELSDGYDTVVGEEGATLSEGQRQRIALARALLRDSPIIILDESSAQVDLITEREIYKNIMALDDKTIILVSHRPSVLKEADKIYSIANGQIIDIGSFDQYKDMMNHGDLLREMEFVH